VQTCSLPISMVSHDAVVADVHISHQEVAGPDTRHAAAFGSAAADGHTLSDGIVIADDGFGGFPPVLQILGSNTAGTERVERVPLADAGASIKNHMRDQHAL